MSKKVTFITTVNHNVGDDFVREGLIWLLKKYFQSEKLKFSNIHKHVPASSYYGLEKMRDLVWSERIEKYLPVISPIDRVIQSDILIQSGAPVFWYHPGFSDCVSGNEWYEALINRRFLKKKGGVLANIAAGSCQKYHSDGSEFMESEKVKRFMKEFFSISKVVTFRDKLSMEIHHKLGLEAPVIPCSSIFAIDNLKIDPSQGDYVVVNYMHGGAHFSFGQNIEFENYFREFKKFYKQLKKSEKRVIFSCHNKKELKEARSIDPNGEFFFSENYIDYINLYAKAKYGVMNRVHGGFIMASLGKPVIIIGNDSRARMAQLVGVKDFYVNDITAENLIMEACRLSGETESTIENMTIIKEKAFLDYMAAFSKFEN